MQEIIDAGLPLPAVNQVPFHLYNARAQADIHAWCIAHNITLLAYSPMGIPDWHPYPTGPGKMPASTTLEDPVLLSITANHAPATPGQVRALGGRVGVGYYASSEIFTLGVLPSER